MLLNVEAFYPSPVPEKIKIHLTGQPASLGLVLTTDEAYDLLDRLHRFLPHRPGRPQPDTWPRG